MPKVMIIDDSLSVLKVAERMLTQAGFEVATAKNGTEALHRLPNERPDVIISDVLMPDKTGYEVCTFVRSHPVLANTPILLISGILTDEVARQAEICRADGILKKPFQGTTLKDRVFELIAKGQQDSPVAAPAQAQTSVTPSAGPVQAEAVQITPEELEAFQQAHAKVKDLETALATERERVTALTKRLSQAEVAQAVQTVPAEGLTQDHPQLQELEAALATERERVTALTERLAQAETRVTQLEATLNAERDAANQLIEQIDELERAAGSTQELEMLLAKEIEKTASLSQRLAEMELAATRAQPPSDDIA